MCPFIKETKSKLEDLVENVCFVRKFKFIDHRVNCIVLVRETNHVDWNFIVLLNFTEV